MDDKLELLTLPSEILDRILIEAVTVRTFHRALKLRLVCSESADWAFAS